jgi:hypothetical protein
MRWEDIDDIMVIEREAFATPYERSFFQKALFKTNIFIFVAERDEQLFGNNNNNNNNKSEQFCELVSALPRKGTYFHNFFPTLGECYEPFLCLKL